MGHLRPQDKFLWRVIFWASVACALLLLAGCVTVSECRAYIQGKFYAECRWDFSSSDC